MSIKPTILNSLAVLILVIINSQLCLSQLNIAGEDRYIFKSDSISIGSYFNNTTDCYYWEPKEFLNDNTLPNPKAGVDKTTEFQVTATGKDFSYSKTGTMTIHYIKVEQIVGVESFASVGSTLNLTARLTDNIALPDGWNIEWGGDAKFSNQQGLSVDALFENPKAKANLFAIISESTDTFKTSLLVVGFEVKELTPNMEYCDGHTIPLYISALPEGTPQSYLSSFSDIVPISEPVSFSFGNPAGTTDLTFTQINNTMQFEVENARWYAYTPDKCDLQARYNISASAKNANGSQIFSKPLEIIVSVSMNCVSGYSTCCVSVFSGFPEISAYQIGPELWTATILPGTVIRDIENYPIELNVHPNSQFYDIVLREEEYHDLQNRGIEPTVCFEKLYVVDSIFNSINRRKSELIQLTEQEAKIAANALYSECLDNEIIRSENLHKSLPCWCDIEYKAKTQFGDLFFGAWNCRYAEKCENH